MKYLNIELSTLRSAEYVGSSPAERGTWLSVSAHFLRGVFKKWNIFHNETLTCSNSVSKSQIQEDTRNESRTQNPKSLSAACRWRR